MRILCLGFVLLAFYGKALAQELDIPPLCAATAERMKRIEAVSGYRLHANLSFNETKYEAWVESRGDRFWVQLLELPPADSVEAETNKKLSALLKSDMRETFMFDGEEMTSYWPRRLQVMIEQAEAFQAPPEIAPIFLQSWTGFMMQRNPGKITFSRFLTEMLPECESKVELDRNRVIISRRTELSPEKSVAFAFRKVEIDATNQQIRATEASGGKGLPVNSTLEWTEIDNVCYVSKGKVSYGDRRTIEWTIDDFTANPRNVRFSFKLDEKALPKGIRIDVEPFNKAKKREIRFTGGDQWKKEYDLKVEAVRLLLQRSDKN